MQSHSREYYPRWLSLTKRIQTNLISFWVKMEVATSRKRRWTLESSHNNLKPCKPMLTNSNPVNSYNPMEFQLTVIRLLTTRILFKHKTLWNRSLSLRISWLPKKTSLKVWGSSTEGLATNLYGGSTIEGKLRRINLINHPQLILHSPPSPRCLLLLTILLLTNRNHAGNKTITRNKDNNTYSLPSKARLYWAITAVSTAGLTHTSRCRISKWPNSLCKTTLLITDHLKLKK